VLDLSVRDLARSAGLARWFGSGAVAPLARRGPGGQLKRLPAHYFQMRDRTIRQLIEAIADGRATLEQALRSPALAQLDERVVEYTAFIEWLERAPALAQRTLLDVGCVLNNALVSDYVARATSMIWLLNPSLEPLQYRDRVAYVLGDIRRCPLPATQRFTLVTCLSVLEHVGMDNTRYGDLASALSHEPEHPERFAADAMAALAARVEPGGSLLVSVPYGVFEYVYEHGRPHAPIYYAFDAGMLEVLLAPIAAWEHNVRIYKMTPNVGWIIAPANDTVFARYAEGTVGAGGVAIISARAPSR
jgi:SAM-dependent methyltransferase